MGRVDRATAVPSAIGADLSLFPSAVLFQLPTKSVKLLSMISAGLMARAPGGRGLLSSFLGQWCPSAVRWDFTLLRHELEPVLQNFTRRRSIVRRTVRSMPSKARSMAARGE